MNFDQIMSGFPVPIEKRVPRDSFDRAPWNRWSFQHMREILPTTEVWKGVGPVWTLATTLQDIDSIQFINNCGEQTTISEWLEINYTDGFCVLSRGNIIYEHYLNGMTERTPHISFSMAKSITSTVAGILIHRGLLDPEDNITTYLPELNGTAWKEAKLRHTLDMTSGVRFVEDYGEYDGLSEVFDSDILINDIASGWRPSRPGVSAPACVWDQILSLQKKIREHGEIFQYRSIETDVLAHCMERATQTRLAELISRELWQPLGVEQSGFFNVDSVGYAFANGGFNAALRDYARFGQMLANSGIGNDRRIVPSAWIEDIFECRPEIFGEPYNATFPRGAYRNQFWIRDANKRVIMARGIFGQLVYVDLESNFVVVKLSSPPESLSIPRDLDTLSAIDAIGRELGLLNKA